ncbi:MAG: lyase family protein [Marinifilaceae bacterium]|jgi:aspartate ammonia-lyase|nr:lyase family protein [Marinifilaceae bacterium]
MCRTETDFLGSIEIPKDALYGIHSLRAKENFENDSKFNIKWYKAIACIKLATYHTYSKFTKALQLRHPEENFKFQTIDETTVDALITAAQELIEGKHFDNFIVPAIQGGAGTSINMNINEIISNRALQILNHKCGDYKKVDPFEHANIYQSTNDVIPSALKLAITEDLFVLENSINELRFELEKKESEYRNVLRNSYTQMQMAVPSSYDKFFGSYNNALSRDWWRVSKCMERIKEINLGGGAVGTGISTPRFYIMNVVQQVQNLTGLALSSSENLSDTTSNLDCFVEIHATLKAHAVNLEKMLSDFRLLSSDLFRNDEFQLPKKQVGSSIMPGKVNPVIPEFVISCAHKVYANDLLVSNLCGQGSLDLNPYIPIIGDCILQSIELLSRANESILKNVVKDLKVDKDTYEKVYRNPSIATALSPYIGYHKASQIAKLMQSDKIDIFMANSELDLIEEEKLERLMEPGNLLQLGFTISDLID